MRDRLQLLFWAGTVAVVVGLILLAAWATGVLPILWLLGLVLFSLIISPTAEWHSKQTIVIETPAGEVTSSVVRGKYMREEWLLRRINSDQWGEALVIEVSPGRYLFAVIEEFKPEEVRIFGSSGSDIERARKLRWMRGQPKEIPPEQYPLMVTFGDLKDPASVMEVDPFKLPATFGAGYRIKSYTLEITGEPVTDGRIEALLPWLPEYHEQRLDGQRYGTSEATNRLANSLSSGFFNIGE